MHVTMAITAGYLMLGLFLLLGKLWGNDDASLTLAATAFLPVWMVTAAMNLWVGVYYAGYELREELPILLLVFLTPAAAAFWSMWHFSR